MYIEDSRHIDQSDCTHTLLLHLSGASAVKRRVINSWRLLKGVGGQGA